MATEMTFLIVASRFDALAGQLRGGFTDLDACWSSDVVSGGRLSRVIEQTIDATHTNTMTMVAEFIELAAECRRRAAVCAQYSAALETYRTRYASYERRSTDWDPESGAPRPTPPSRPSAPAAWAEATWRSGN